jgi:hypothetical protein
MGHNVWSHITAVQEANRQYDTNIRPAMMDSGFSDRKTSFQLDRRYFKEMVDAIFAESDRTKAEKLVDHYKKYFDTIIGTRGNTGKALTNASGRFNALFEVVEPTVSELYHRDDSGLDDSKLDELEAEIGE